MGEQALIDEINIILYMRDTVRKDYTEGKIFKNLSKYQIDFILQNITAPLLPPLFAQLIELRKSNKLNHQKLLLSGLNDFFYKNQHNEDKFPTFRCMDRILVPAHESDFGAEYFAYEVCE